MSATKEANGAPAGPELPEAWKSCLDFWTQAAAVGGEQTRSVLDAMTGAKEPAAARRQWLEAQARIVDAFLRSPAFLEAMRRQFEASVLLKTQTEDLAQEFARLTG